MHIYIHLEYQLIQRCFLFNVKIAFFLGLPKLAAKKRLSFNAGSLQAGGANRGAAGGYGLDVAARHAAVRTASA